MMTAMLTARNILAGERLYDVWNVNEDAEYHEAGRVRRASALDSAALGSGGPGGGGAAPQRDIPATMGKGRVTHVGSRPEHSGRDRGSPAR